MPLGLRRDACMLCCSCRMRKNRSPIKPDTLAAAAAAARYSLKQRRRRRPIYIQPCQRRHSGRNIERPDLYVIIRFVRLK